MVFWIDIGKAPLVWETEKRAPHPKLPPVVIQIRLVLGVYQQRHVWFEGDRIFVQKWIRAFMNNRPTGDQWKPVNSWDDILNGRNEKVVYEDPA